ncbi:MAG: Gfo/Idh/MocA family oxidoreductase [Clostridia bacterium]|nr:Gfo/Idh/MocA family oxidoreductase [Clostridia bacterium]
MKKLTAIILGYGMRGQAYAKYAVNVPEELEIVAVADKEESRRDYAKKLHSLPDNMVVDNWKKLTSLPKMADFAIIATQDNMHLEPALECIEKGYNLLLEKPIAPTAKECKEITLAAEKKGVKVIVCHVLRFTALFRTIKDIIDRGELGDIMSVMHTENVGHLHYSHSFVRGNWRNSEESSPMILAKSCHDTDLIQWLIGKKCTKVQSFGSLQHFKCENQPEGAPDYCLMGCPHSDECFYEPVRFYVENKKNPWRDTVADKVNATDEEILAALKDGPYGRCVYKCDNNVIDRQVVNMEFEDGCTVSFTLATLNKGGRFIRIYGTRGELIASMDTTSSMSIYSYDTQETKDIEVDKIDQGIASGHGGGDTGIMFDTIRAFSNDVPSKSVTDIRTSYLNHLIAFAAEESRLSSIVINMDEFEKNIVV